MRRQVFIPMALCMAVLLSLTSADDAVPSANTTTTMVTTNATCSDNVTSSNCDIGKPPEETDEGLFPVLDLAKNKAMFLRTFYVLIAVTAVVVLYFVIKSVMLRRKNNKTRKYGIVGMAASELEMQPLDQGDDDDDMTLFEARSAKLK